MRSPAGFARSCKPVLTPHVHVWTRPITDQGWISSGKWTEEGFEAFSPKYWLDHDQKKAAPEEHQHREGDGPPALHCVRTCILFSLLNTSLLSPDGLSGSLTIFSDILFKP